MGKSKVTLNRKTSSGNHVKLKPGSMLCDTTKTKWTLGKSIGAGGFGDVYLVSQDGVRVSSDTKSVAKVELQTNGPLFVEMHFYLRVGLEENILKWKENHGLKHLGMPRYIGFGSHASGTERYRFLILERYGHDINSLFVKNGRRFPLKTVLALGIQIIDILEYIHYYGYIHADIKGSNLVLGLGKKDENKVFLLDFGLACLYVDRYGRHKEFNHDLRRAHDGTLEYTSRDAHVGAHSRRGDLEVLGYNLVQWLCGELPWEKDLSDPDVVAAAKNLYMRNTSHLMDKCFPRGGAPVVIHQYLRYVAGLGFTARPDYDRLRSMFRQGMRAAGLIDNGLLHLGSIASMKMSRKRGHGSDNENTRISKKSKCTAKSLRRPCAPVQSNVPHVRHLKSKLLTTDQTAFERKTRQKSTTGRTATLRSVEFDWVKVLQSHPERDAKPLAKAKKPKRVVQRVLEDVAESLRRKPENPRANPTPAMLKVLDSKKVIVRASKRSARCDSHNVKELSALQPVYLTPAMEEVLHKKMSSGQNNVDLSTVSKPIRKLRDRRSANSSLKSIPKIVLLNTIPEEATTTTKHRGRKCNSKTPTRVLRESESLKNERRSLPKKTKNRGSAVEDKEGSPRQLRNRNPVNCSRRASQKPVRSISERRTSAIHKEQKAGGNTPWELRVRNPISYTELQDVDLEDFIKDRSLTPNLVKPAATPILSIGERITRTSVRNKESTSCKSNGYHRTKSISRNRTSNPSKAEQHVLSRNTNNKIDITRRKKRCPSNTVVCVKPTTSLMKTRSSTKMSYRIMDELINRNDDEDFGETLIRDEDEEVLTDDDSCSVAELTDILTRNGDLQLETNYLRNETMKNWRPPTPPRKSTNTFLPICWNDRSRCASSRSRRNSVISAYSVNSTCTNATVLRPRKRREVSPSEVEFLPRLRSGRPCDDNENYSKSEKLCFRPASTPLFRSHNFKTSRSTTPHKLFQSNYNLFHL